MTTPLRSTFAKVGAAAVLALTLSACGEADSGSNTSLSEIDEQQAKWAAANIESYDFQYKVRCLCPTKDRRLIVRDGRIERVDYKSVERTNHESPEITKTGKHRNGDRYDDGHHYRDHGEYYDNDYIYTVRSLFSLARDAHLNAHSVYIEYHPTFGYPTDLRIDWDYNWIDDEYQVLVVDFVLQ